MSRLVLNLPLRARPTAVAVDAIEDGTFLYVRWLSIATIAVYVLAALFLALTLPLHAHDALAYSEWSRLIASHWHLRFPSITDQTYHRPLFYVLQGVMWGVIGFSEQAGRLLAGAFSVLLLVAVYFLARSGRWSRTQGLVAALFVLLVPDFARQIVSGLTDVPVAATVALAGLAVWRSPGTPARIALTAAAAAAAVLTKPTALFAVAGLALAQAVGPPADLRARLRTRVAPIVGGAALAFVYDVVQARYLHEGLSTYLSAGTSKGYYADLADQARRAAFFGSGWLGDYLRTLLLFALVYALARAVGAAHRSSVGIAVPTAIVLSWLGPFVAAKETGWRVGTFAAPHLALVSLLLVGSAAFALAVPEDLAPSRLELGRLLLWAAPPLAAWIAYAGFDARLLAPAWPPLFVLMAVSFIPALVGLARYHRFAALVPLVVLVYAISDNAYLLDDLGKAGWEQVRALRSSEVFHYDKTRRIVLPAFSDALDLVRHEVGAQGRLLTPEGRFRFYLPSRVAQGYPLKCADLKGYRAFVLLTDQGTKQYMEQTLHVSGEPSFWASCTQPKLTQLSDGSNGYAVFRVGS